MFDPFVPQAYNVDIGQPEAADAQPRGGPMPAPVPYAIPEPVAMQLDAQLYPLRRHGVLTTRRIGVW